MAASNQLLQGIKSILRSRNITYKALSKKLGVSEATVKRDLSRGGFSLRRLDEICKALQLGVSDLIQPPNLRSLVTELSESQERALVADPRMLVVTYLLTNDWRFQEIVSAFQLSDNELVSILLKLDELRIVEFRPPHRVKKLTARNFSWRKDGPVHAFFMKRFVPEFFASAFGGAGEAFRFIGGSLSAESAAQFRTSMEQLAVQFERLAREDARLPHDQRHATCAILAVREWHFYEFADLKRRAA
jgi:DNA-binding Xre family transcriptional regulator